MMRSRLSLKSLARPALNSVILVIALLFAGCSSSTAPTFLKENFADAVRDICQKEYHLEVKTRLVGTTLWIYLPLENLLVKSDKPDKYVEKFKVEENKGSFEDGVLSFAYLIKPVPEKDKYQEYKYDKKVIEKINNVWTVLRRVLFSTDRSRQEEPRFFSFVVADITNGIEISQLFYYLDIKKVTYGYISWGEYQHRTIQDSGLVPDAIDDRGGAHLNYHDVTFEEFLAGQIMHRIRLKFQKPEVDSKADIDKEIMKIAIYVLKTYGFHDFTRLQLKDLATENTVELNEAAVWARSTE